MFYLIQISNKQNIFGLTNCSNYDSVYIVHLRRAVNDHGSARHDHQSEDNT